MDNQRDRSRSRLWAGWGGLMVLLAALASSPCWAADKAKAKGGGGAADAKQIREVIQQYQKGWLTLDLNLLQGLWDKDYPKIIYVATELKEPIKGWEGVKKYYQDGVQYFAEVKEFTLKDLTVDNFGNTGFAFAPYHFEAVTKGESPKTIKGDGQVSFILRKVGGKWRLTHYHESAPHADQP